MDAAETTFQKWKYPSKESAKKNKDSKKVMETLRSATLEDLVAATTACHLKPRQFFVAYHGVLTLAFSGFPPSLVLLKDQIAKNYPSLRPEYFGSRWPKVTLGALKDDTNLTFEQLLALHRLCEEYKDKLGSTEGGWESLDVSQISAVTFECCSLERLLMRKDMPLRRPDETTRQEEIAKDQLETVDTVLQEFHIDNMKEYWTKVQQPERRESHYRKPRIETTLVSFLGEVHPLVKQFRQDVDNLLPGCYTWFEDTSLHLTIRALA